MEETNPTPDRKTTAPESFFRELLDHVINAVVIYEAVDGGNDFVIIDSNKAAENIEGIDKKTIIGKRVLTVFPFLKGSEIISVFKDVWETGIPGRCLVKLAPDGKLFGWRDFHVYKWPTGEIIAIYEDVSEKKQKEEEQNRLISILENTSDIVSTSDLDGSITFMNKAGRAFLGWDDDLDIKRKIENVHTPRAYKHLRDHGIPAAIENGTWVGESALIDQHGQEIPVSQVIISHKSQMGEVAFLSTIIRDISDQKRVEVSLKKSEETIRAANALLNSLIDSVPDLIFHKDCSSVYMGSNIAFSKFAGLDVSDIIGKSDYDLFEKSLAEYFIQKDKAVLDSGKPRRNEEWVTYPDGTLVLLDTLKTPYYGPENEILGVIGISRDITEKKRDEQQLIRQASAIENAVEEVVITDRDGNIEYVNPAFEKITGYTSEEVLGKNPRILKSGKQDEAYYKNLWDTILSGKAWSGQIINKTKSGAFVEMEATISPIFDKGQRIIGFVSVKRDVTEQHKMEKLIRENQKIEAIGNLAGGIAHDFNNILTAILGYTDLALMNVSENDKIFEDLSEVKNAGTRAKELVGQILTFSRRGDQELVPQKIQPVVKEAVKLLRATLPSTIGIELQINNEAAPIMANPTQIHQVIMNLCTNAFHSMADQRGAITIGLNEVILDDNQELAIDEIVPSGNYVELAVADSGMGIAPDIIPRIFEPYFTTKEHIEGTGLGLAVVHGIVTDHKGFIKVDSKLGEGTKIRIYFPALALKANPIIETQADVPGGNETILLIDDEVKILDIGKRNFEKLGYTVNAFRNSTHAMHFFKNHHDDIDIVITDMTMPHVTGLDISRQVLKLKPGLPVIMCTGFTDVLNSEEAQKMGIKAYLMKPLEYNKLAAIVRKLLNEQKQESRQDGPKD